MRLRVLVPIFLLVIASARGGLSVAPARATPTSFRVNSLSDHDDGACQQPPDGDCTLREVIAAANANGNPAEVDSVAFAAGLGAVRTIAVGNTPGSTFGTPLPTIAEPLSIQANTGGSTVILDGAHAGPSAIGLQVTAGASTLRALTIVNFAGGGLRLAQGGGNTVDGNSIGFIANGIAPGNGGSGIVVDGSANNAIETNVVVGSGQHGVLLQGVGAGGNRVEHNLIGTTLEGGVFPNLGHGVLVQDGGPVTVSGNTIANSAGDGVAIVGSGSPPARAAILGNAVFDNVGLGIDLADDGVTENDSLDADDGPNGRQNFPDLTSARTDGGATRITGLLTSAVETAYWIELFSSPSCDSPSQHGEGARFEALVPVVTNSSGAVTFDTFIMPVAVGRAMTATATALDSAGSPVETSEFSACVVVETALPTPTPTPSATPTVTPTATVTGTPPTATATPTPTPTLTGEQGWGTNGPQGGNINVLALDPLDSNRLYAGAGPRDVFGTTDGGATWRWLGGGLPPDSPGQAPSVIRDLALVPGSATVFLATDDPSGGTLFKSTDGGTSWVALAATGLPDGTRLGAPLAVDAHALLTIYTVTRQQVCTSPASCTGSAGLARSTDGGASWTQVLGSGLSTSGSGMAFSTLAVDPNAPGTLYAFVEGQTCAAGVPPICTLQRGVFKSVDYGDHWASATNGLPDFTQPGSDLLALAVDPSTPNTLYAAPLTTGSEPPVFKSTGGGADWSPASSGLPDGRVQALVVAPGPPGTVYAAFGKQPRGIYKSTDGGTSWLPANGGLVDVSVDELAAGPTAVYAGADADGVLKSTDGGASWTPANYRLVAHSIASLAIHPQNPAIVYAGATGCGVFRSPDAGLSWGFPRPNVDEPLLLVGLVIDPGAPTTLYVSTTAGLTQAGGVLKSTDGGATWKPASAGLPGSFGVFDLVIDPLAPSTLYARVEGFNGVYKTTDGGGSWQPSNSGLPAPFGNAPTVFSLALRHPPAGPAATLYAGLVSQGVYKSTDGGASWFAASNGLPLDVTVDALGLDVAGGSTLYAGVTISTFDPGTSTTAEEHRVYKTIDGGASWAVASANLPSDSRITTLALDPTAPTTAYAGTAARGVFKTVDGGTWLPLETGLTSLAINALALDPRDPPVVYAATDGGVFRLPRPPDGGPQLETCHLAAGGGAATPTPTVTPTAMPTASATATPTAPPLGGCPVEHGAVYAADLKNSRVQRSTDDGTTWQLVGKGAGTPPGQFRGPGGVATDAAGRLLFVADTKNNRIQRSTDGGASWQVIAAKGKAPNQVKGPHAVAYDEVHDRLYVADTRNSRLLVAGGAGTAASPSFGLFAGATVGNMLGKVAQPRGVAVDCAGAVYVADTKNSRLQVNPSGQPNGWAIFAGATAGKGPGQVSQPRGIFVDGRGRVFVGDTKNNRVLVNSSATPAGWQQLLGPGKAVGQARSPDGVALAVSGSLFVADTKNNRLQKLPPGAAAVVVGGPGTAVGQFNAPAGLR